MKKSLLLLTFSVGVLGVGSYVSSREGFFNSRKITTSPSILSETAPLVVRVATTTNSLNKDSRSDEKLVQNKQVGYEFSRPYFLDSVSAREITNHEPHVEAWQFPKSWSKGTNLGEALITLQIMSSKNISECLKDYYATQEEIKNSEIKNPWLKISQESNNGLMWYFSQFTDVGTSNYYQEFTYESLVQNKCYRWNLELHSVNLSIMQDSDPSVKQFDDQRYINVFKKVFTSFKLQTS